MVLDICATHAMTWRSPHGTPMLDSGAHNHWSTSCHNHYVAAMQCWRPRRPFWFGMIRDAGLTEPCLAEGTGLVGIRCPDVTRLVDMPQPSCYYGGKYDKGRCERHDCPRVSLGHGAWHVAFPKLIKPKGKDKLADRYPQLDLSVLHSRAEEAGRSLSELCTERKGDSTPPCTKGRHSYSRAPARSRK
jgi:hypothetical protein